MKSILITFLLSGLLFFQLHSQENKNAVSARLGLSSGFTYQHQIDQFRGYKGMLSFRDGGVQVTALLESCRPLYVNFTDKLFYYTGMGAHIGYTRYQPQRGFFANPFRVNYRYGHFAPVIGLDAIIGLEWRMNRAPISFCLDAKPFFELFGQNIFRLAVFDIGLSMKFTF
jgi:hypothetical protein